MRTSASICLLAAALSGCSGTHATTHAPGAPNCGGPLDGTFLQLTSRQLNYDVSAWREVLRRARALGMNSIVVQYTGDEQGSFDSRTHEPTGTIGALLYAADTMHTDVWLGLYADRIWPRGDSLSQLPRPLGDLDGEAQLVMLCRSHPSCAGWYLPQEPNEAEIATADDERRVRDWLHGALVRLHAITPEYPVAISTYAAGTYDPAAFSAMWDRLLDGNRVDVVMLQDGAGTTRRAVAEPAAYLNAFRTVADVHGARLWSVIELFSQTQGAPHDTLAFRAVAAPFPRVREGMAATRPYVERRVGFSLLDYMDPSANAGAARLAHEYAKVCVPR